MLGLGIDAGGTYTDAVVVDLARTEVLSAAKALTTHHDLCEGVVASVSQLDASLLPRVQLVALSTTLATNSIVEGRGAHAGLILLGYEEYAVPSVQASPVRAVRGRLDIEGEELEPLDLPAVRAVARDLLDSEHVQALAVSGMCSVMNPAHELAAMRAIRECVPPDFPLVCGHELSLELNAVRRATTAFLNARLMPVLRDLLDAVKRALADLGIAAPLMVVRGDGSLMTQAAAARRPVETLLSGPAASVVGALTLTGLRDALVVDMGGTTTDIAVVTDGRPGISADGATVGGRRTSVRAADLRTCGLGGDSRVWIKGGELRVGPARAVPLALLAHHCPSVLAQQGDLRRFAASSLIQPCDFFVLQRAEAAPHNLTAGEQAVLCALRDGPLSQWHLGNAIGASHPSLVPVSRLEETGAIRRASLTPTDVLHAEGRFTAWSVDASVAAVELYAARLGVEPEAVRSMVVARVRRVAVGELLARVMPALDGQSHVRRAMLDSLLCEDGGLVEWRAQLRRPIVAIGAPAAAWLGSAADALSAQLVVPVHADVANAVGAITGALVFTETATISLDANGCYVVHSSVERSVHGCLEDAKERAIEVAGGALRSRLEEEASSIAECRFDVDVADQRAVGQDGEPLYVGSRVEVRAVCRPALR